MSRDNYQLTTQNEIQSDIYSPEPWPRWGSWLDPFAIVRCLPSGAAGAHDASTTDEAKN